MLKSLNEIVTQALVLILYRKQPLKNFCVMQNTSADKSFENIILLLCYDRINLCGLPLKSISSIIISQLKCKFVQFNASLIRFSIQLHILTNQILKFLLNSTASEISFRLIHLHPAQTFTIWIPTFASLPICIKYICSVYYQRLAL